MVLQVTAENVLSIMAERKQLQEFYAKGRNMSDQVSKHVYVLGCGNPSGGMYMGYLSTQWRAQRFERAENAFHYDTMDALLRAMRRAKQVQGSLSEYFIEKFYIRKISIDEFTSVGNVS